MHFTNMVKFFIILVCSVLFCNFISCKQNDSSSFEEEENYNEPDNTISVVKITDIETLKSLFSMIDVINANNTARVTCGDENWNGFYSGDAASQKGVFVSGESEKTTRIVELSAYSIGKHEVTQELYGAVMGKNPSYCRANARYPLLELEEEGEDKNRPVENVSWYDAVAFCNELTKLLDSENECVYYSDKECQTVYTEGNKIFYNPEKKAIDFQLRRSGSLPLAEEMLKSQPLNTLMLEGNQESATL